MTEEDALVEKELARKPMKETLPLVSLELTPDTSVTVVARWADAGPSHVRVGPVEIESLPIREDEARSAP